jgi:hypothetical protein
MKKATKIIKAIKIAAVLFAAFSFLRVCQRNYAADLAYEKAKDSLDQVQLSDAFDHAEAAIKLNPLEPNYYRMRARVLINYLAYKDRSVRTVTKQLIINDLQNAYNLNPENLVTIRNIIPLYYFVATENVSAPAVVENVDPYFLEPVKNFYAQVKDYSPSDAGVYALIAKYEKRLGLDSEYNDSVEKVRVLRPDLLDWYESFK